MIRLFGLPRQKLEVLILPVFRRWFAVSCDSVQAHMFRAGQHLKIVRAVIRSVPVEVMHDLITLQLAADHLFRYNPVLQHLLTANPNQDIPVSIQLLRHPLARIGARLRTESLPAIFHRGHDCVKRDAALRTGQFDTVAARVTGTGATTESTRVPVTGIERLSACFTDRTWGRIALHELIPSTCAVAGAVSAVPGFSLPQFYHDLEGIADDF